MLTGRIPQGTRTLRGRHIIFGWAATAVVGSLLLAALPVLLSHVFPTSVILTSDRVEDIPSVFALLTVVSAVAGLPATVILWVAHRIWTARGATENRLFRRTLTGQIGLGFLTFVVIFGEEVAHLEFGDFALAIGGYLFVGSLFLLLFAERSDQRTGTALTE